MKYPSLAPIALLLCAAAPVAAFESPSSDALALMRDYTPPAAYDYGRRLYRQPAAAYRYTPPPAPRDWRNRYQPYYAVPPAPADEDLPPPPPYAESLYDQTPVEDAGEHWWGEREAPELQAPAVAVPTPRAAPPLPSPPALAATPPPLALPGFADIRARQPMIAAVAHPPPQVVAAPVPIVLYKAPAASETVARVESEAPEPEPAQRVRAVPTVDPVQIFESKMDLAPGY